MFMFELLLHMCIFSFSICTSFKIFQWNCRSACWTSCLLRWKKLISWKAKKIIFYDLAEKLCSKVCYRNTLSVSTKNHLGLKRKSYDYDDDAETRSSGLYDKDVSRQIFCCCLRHKLLSYFYVPFTAFYFPAFSLDFAKIVLYFWINFQKVLQLGTGGFFPIFCGISVPYGRVLHSFL